MCIVVFYCISRAHCIACILLAAIESCLIYLVSNNIIADLFESMLFNGIKKKKSWTFSRILIKNIGDWRSGTDHTQIFLLSLILILSIYLLLSVVLFIQYLDLQLNTYIYRICCSLKNAMLLCLFSTQSQHCSISGSN